MEILRAIFRNSRELWLVVAAVAEAEMPAVTHVH